MNAPQPSTGSAAFRILAGAASPNSAAASQGGRLKTTASASKRPPLSVSTSFAPPVAETRVTLCLKSTWPP